MNRHTKIICTLGPASSKEAMIAKMAMRGMDVARLNFSHGNFNEHQKLINKIRKVNKKHKFNIQILQDLEGFRIRIGYLKKNIILEKHQVVTMSREKQGVKNHIPFDYYGDIKKIKKNTHVFIDDGKIHLRVQGFRGKRLVLEVIQGGVLKERKGMNIPKIRLHPESISEKDKEDLKFGIQTRVDMVAQSFVRNKKDILHLIDVVKPQLPDCKIIAKIEGQEGVRNLDSIIDACDGVMIARGDLGVSFPIYKIPVLQKHIIRRCNRKKKFVITATQMLDSMIEEGRPTRAEVSDVANAIFDGTDYVMLSAETAIGRYPSRSIKMMSQIVEYSESYEEFRP